MIAGLALALSITRQPEPVSLPLQFPLTDHLPQKSSTLLSLQSKELPQIIIAGRLAIS